MTYTQTHKSPFYTQNYNRYSYVYNNPLKYTDPTGYVSQAILAQQNATAEANIAWQRRKNQEFLDNWARYKAISGGDGALANIHWGSGGGGVSIGMSIIGDKGYEEFGSMSSADYDYRSGLNENGQFVRAFTPKATMLTFDSKPNAPSGIDNLRVHYSNGKVVQGSYEMLQYLRTLGSDGDEIKAKLMEGIQTENGDGYITYEEAYWTYKLGKGKVDLFADLNKLDLSKISASDFPGGIGSSNSFNFAGTKYYTNLTQALVYGSITLHLLPGNKVVASSDIYDFDLKMVNYFQDNSTLKRDALTVIGNMVNGVGTPFYIHFRGSAIIKP